MHVVGQVNVAHCCVMLQVVHQEISRLSHHKESTDSILVIMCLTFIHPMKLLSL